MALDTATLEALIVNDPALKGIADGGSLSTLCDALNANPAPPLSVSALLAMITDEDHRAKVLLLPSAARIADDVNAQDRGAVAMWAIGLGFGATPIIPKAEAQAIASAVTNPSQKSKVEAAFSVGAVATIEDCQRAVAALHVDNAVADLKALRWPTVSVYIAPVRLASEGITDATMAAAKARHEGTVAGVFPIGARDTAIAAVTALDAPAGAQLAADWKQIQADAAKMVADGTPLGLQSFGADEASVTAAMRRVLIALDVVKDTDPTAAADLRAQAFAEVRRIEAAS